MDFNTINVISYLRNIYFTFLCTELQCLGDVERGVGVYGFVRQHGNHTPGAERAALLGKVPRTVQNLQSAPATSKGKECFIENACNIYCMVMWLAHTDSLNIF